MKNLLRQGLVASSLLVTIVGQANSSRPSNPPSSSPLFQDSAPVNLELSTDFERIRQVNENGDWDHDQEDHDQARFWAEGVIKDLANPSRSLRADVRTRGMSNLTDAAFPKLRVEIKDEEDLNGTIFKGARNFRINTHANEQNQSEESRLGPNSPFREAMLFDIARALYLETPAYRRANIHYINQSQGINITRQALIIETNKKLTERLEAQELDEQQYLPNRRISQAVAAVFHLYHAMIRNADAQLRINEPSNMTTEMFRGIFNAFVLQRADGSQLPVVYDLNKSDIVLEPIEYSLPRSAEFQLQGLELLKIRDLAPLRSKFQRSHLIRAIEFFKSKQQSILQIIARATVDQVGRSQASHHINAFYSVVDRWIQMPVIIKTDVQFFSTAQMRESKLKDDPMNETPGRLRLGTPVRILGREGNALRVAIVDFKNDLQDGESSVGYIRDEASAIGLDIPTNLIGTVDTRDLSFGY